MSERIEKTFAELKGKRAALIAYIMGYDPDYSNSLDIMKSLPDAGADIIELGVPFSDPMADGPVIQEAANRSLKAGASLKGILKMLGEFRESNANTPVVLMGYYNPIYKYGIESFVKDAIAAGADGVIIVDLTPEEEGEFIDVAKSAGLSLIKLTAPTTTKSRAEMVLKKSSGFVYHITVTGVTGVKKPIREEVSEALDTLREVTNLPIAVGFGIKTPEQVKEMAGIADGVVVGSAIVKKIAEGEGLDKISSFVKELASNL